ncbi:hypothetical protein PHYSODRAFT_246550 [Phytophthora sojae]|uniref:Uncharacterized protein n=1 Tax=Phytophthora sojae (strain P6497) TaxID=1094619 RepID=G5AD39_PHYSP|nr:hypothetical protein PHYSODRAFT_246550 [Phytophthora sojae]EGZ06093.1 hypothetical protein PHYSODRAFT_246550 [Phytophthora sojae]|eukprot:XP_009537990.1 hypothetical protein PHYSODRAFT_246550 [Phytophthora sojae]
MDHIKTAANFDVQGVQMEVCPSGDSQTGKYMRLSVTSLTELDTSGAVVASVDNVSSTTFVSTLEVGVAKTQVAFNLTASVYQGNATVPYGSQTIPVPAGALKFTADIAGWPKPVKKPKNVSDSVGDADIERVDLGDSMFMDVPSLVILDGGVEESLLNVSVVEAAGDTSLEWIFPSFSTSLHYDPVLGGTSATTATTDSGVNAGDTSGSTSDVSVGDPSSNDGSGSISVDAGSSSNSEGSAGSSSSGSSTSASSTSAPSSTPAPTTSTNSGEGTKAPTATATTGRHRPLQRLCRL